MRILFSAVAAVLLAVPAWGQDAGDTADEPAAPADAAEAGAAAESGAENSGDEPAAEGAAAEGPAAGDAAGGPVVVDVEEGGVLDDQTFEGEEDDFIPSEEIPVDQPIPFPTDI